jgi:CPA1 family monovalent cation:H+ antiporter
MVLIAYLVVLLTRAVPVYGLLGLADYRFDSIPWAWRHVTFWSGLRGALAVALALSVSGVAGVDSRVAAVAYGVVLLSLLVQGGLMAPLARTLKLAAA